MACRGKGEIFIGSLLDLSVEGWSMSSSFCTWEDDCPILWLQLGFHSDCDNYRLVSNIKLAEQFVEVRLSRAEPVNW